MTLDEMIAELNEFRRKHPESGSWPVVSKNREYSGELEGPQHYRCPDYTKGLPVPETDAVLLDL